MENSTKQKTKSVQVGQVFNRLTIIKKLSERDSTGNILFECVCECGKTTKVAGTRLKQGKTRSCGCFRQEQVRKAVQKGPGVSGLNQVLNSYQFQARKRNLAFLLTREEFATLTKQICHYCGTAPQQSQVTSVKAMTVEGIEHGRYTYNGVDRKINSIGYTIENCVACCGACNLAKRDIDYQDFLALIEKIHAHLLKDSPK